MKVSPDLHQQPFIALGREISTRSETDAFLAQAKARPTIVAEAQWSAAICDLVLFDWLASAAAGLLSSYVWGRLADRSSRQVLMYAAVLALFALMAGLAVLPHPGWMKFISRGSNSNVTLFRIIWNPFFIRPERTPISNM